MKLFPIGMVIFHMLCRKRQFNNNQKSTLNHKKDRTQIIK